MVFGNKGRVAPSPGRRATCAARRRRSRGDDLSVVGANQLTWRGSWGSFFSRSAARYYRGGGRGVVVWHDSSLWHFEAYSFSFFAMTLFQRWQAARPTGPCWSSATSGHSTGQHFSSACTSTFLGWRYIALSGLSIGVGVGIGHLLSSLEKLKEWQKP